MEKSRLLGAVESQAIFPDPLEKVKNAPVKK
jgi:hypothetical protein